MDADFQRFQHAFGDYLRAPYQRPRPAGVPARGAAVYQELVFNNLCGFLDACFPICRQLLGETRWRRLNRSFQRDWPLTTPWFRDIPYQFTCYLATARIAQPLPRWFGELAHYEWAELAVDTLETPKTEAIAADELLHTPLHINPAMLLLTYRWPVHRIGTGCRPRHPQETHLAVYRDRHLQVRFSELNALTQRLLTLLGSDAPDNDHTGDWAIRQLAEEIHHPDPARLLVFGSALLADLQTQEIILGAKA